MSVDNLITPFEARFAPGVAALCRVLGWPSYADPAIAERGCAAPGAVVFVAVADDAVIGFAQILTDGIVQAYHVSRVVNPAPCSNA